MTGWGWVVEERELLRDLITINLWSREASAGEILMPEARPGASVLPFAPSTSCQMQENALHLVISSSISPAAGHLPWSSEEAFLFQ